MSQFHKNGMFKSKFDPGAGIIYSSITGDVSVRDLFDYIYHLDKEFRGMEGPLILSDFRKAEIRFKESMVGLELTEVKQLAVSRLTRYRFVCNALLSDRDEAFLKFYAYISQNVPNYHLEVFTDPEMAEHWLREKKEELKGSHWS